MFKRKKKTQKALKNAAKPQGTQTNVVEAIGQLKNSQQKLEKR